MRAPVCGVDVGIRRSVVAALVGRDVIYVGSPVSMDCILCGIDAPLTLSNGPFRDCDREVLKLGIALYPVNVGFMKRLHESALDLIRHLKCSYAMEVYPHATRKLLGFPFSKRKVEGRRRIEESLKEHLNLGKHASLDADELDALTAALTVKMFLEGRAAFVGRECRILIPLPSGRDGGPAGGGWTIPGGYKIFRP